MFVMFRNQEALPEKTMSLNYEKCLDGKTLNEYLTSLFCCNMLGDLEKPLITGKT